MEFGPFAANIRGSIPNTQIRVEDILSEVTAWRSG
jgi:hypothetical protein